MCMCVFIFFFDITDATEDKLHVGPPRDRGEDLFKWFRYFLLPHLSRMLIGELIEYEGIRRPSVVRLSVCQHFLTTSPLKA